MIAKEHPQKTTYVELSSFVSKVAVPLMRDIEYMLTNVKKLGSSLMTRNQTVQTKNRDTLLSNMIANKFKSESI